MSLIKNILSTRNVGTFDRLLRFALTPLSAALYFTGHIEGVAAAVLAVLAAMLLVTAVTGSCSVYYMLGLSTCPTSGKQNLTGQ